MCEFIDQDQLWMTFENSIYIQFRKLHVVVFHLFVWQYFQPRNEFFCLRSFMGFHIAHNYIPALFLTLMGSFEHGIRLTYTGDIAKENFEFPTFRLFGPGLFEEFIRVGT